MEPIRDPQLEERLHAVFDLYELAEQMMRMKIRRRHPELTDEEVERRLIRWLEKRPDHDLESEPVGGAQPLRR